MCFAADHSSHPQGHAVLARQVIVARSNGGALPTT